MKFLPLAMAILLSAALPAQNYEQEPGTSAPPVPEPQLAPVLSLRDYGIMFVSLTPGAPGMVWMMGPDGKTSGVVPVSTIAAVSAKGYKAITVGTLVDAGAVDAKLIQELQKRLSDVTSDYDRLVARYNRLAAISAEPPMQAQPAPDNSQLMKMMLLQSLFQRAPAPIQIDVRTMNCTQFPALCAGR